MPVWILEFDSQESSSWYFVFGSRREALAKGRQLERDGYKRVKAAADVEGRRYSIQKAEEFYLGA